jgi:transposase
MSNRYYRHSRISESKFRQILRCFVEDKTAVETASKTNLDRKSVNKIFLKIRRRIIEESMKKRPKLPFSNFKTKNPFFIADSEADCKRYSAKYEPRILVVVFLKGRIRADIVYTESKETIEEIARNLRHLQNEKIHHCGYAHFNINSPAEDNLRFFVCPEEVPRYNSANWLSYFLWRIKKSKGILRDKFILHLRETEWRTNKIAANENLKPELEDEELFNLISKDLYDELLEIFRKDPLEKLLI